MSAITQKQPANIEQDRDEPGMIHLTEPPYTHGLCGIPLGEGPLEAEGIAVECVVCAEIGGGWDGWPE